jgi:hypothetical protein
MSRKAWTQIMTFEVGESSLRKATMPKKEIVPHKTLSPCRAHVVSNVMRGHTVISTFLTPFLHVGTGVGCSFSS